MTRHDDENEALTDEERRLVESTRRFDLRRIIGGVLALFGILVGIVGLVDPAADTDPNVTGGIPINLWSGAGMLVVGVFFFVWDRLAPVPAEDILRSARASAEQAAKDEIDDPAARPDAGGDESAPERA